MKRNKLNNKVAIIMGSQSDHSIMKECAKILKTLKIKYQISIVSAHRTPKRMFEFAESASKNGKWINECWFTRSFNYWKF